MESLSFLKCIIFTFFTLLLTASTSLSYALEPTSPQIIGQVIWVKGGLKAALPNAAARVLVRRSTVYEHDKLMTDPASTGEIVFTDNSVLALREDSIVQIDHYRYGKGTTPSNDTFVVNVTKGGFRTITGAISKNNPGGYKAVTPVATIGVSGTVYSLYFNRIKGTLAAKLDKGIISISNEQGSLQLTKCGAGQVGSGCINQLYAQVNGTNIAPAAVAQQPAVFNAEPPVTPTTFPNKPSGSGTGGSFCIS